MKDSIKKGFGFGLTYGVITTLGLMVGLSSGTSSPKVVIGGILIIAIADAMSDALGIHISEESENAHSAKEIWEATVVTFFAKFIFSSIFIIPVIFFPLNQAVITSVVFGLFLIVIFSFYMAKKQGIKPYGVITEHLVITILVIFLTNYIGSLINKFF